MQLTPHFGTAVPSSLTEFLGQALISPANPWYLFALAVFFPISKIGMRTPRLMIAAAVIATVLAQAGWLTAQLNLMSLPLNFIWFALGALYGPAILRRAARPTVVIVVSGLSLYALPLAVMTVLGE